MSLLEQMWDDTVAGPRPDSGLGKLRKHRTFGFRSATGNDSDGGGSVKSYGGAAAPEEMTRVTRSIMIVRPPGYQSGSTPPVSPAGSTPPVSPFSGETTVLSFSFPYTSKMSIVSLICSLNDGNNP
ncbi:Dormancy-associated protein homolog 3 [Linum grandiflorum]